MVQVSAHGVAVGRDGDDVAGGHVARRDAAADAARVLDGKVCARQVKMEPQITCPMVWALVVSPGLLGRKSVVRTISQPCVPDAFSP